MNTNIYERKEFLNASWISPNATELFTSSTKKNKTIIQINLLRATANEAEMFKSVLKEISEKNPLEIIIDLSQSNFIDSTFLSSILNFKKSYSSKVDLVVSDSRQMTIFKITKLDKIFNIHENLDAALVS